MNHEKLTTITSPRFPFREAGAIILAGAGQPAVAGVQLYNILSVRYVDSQGKTVGWLTNSGKFMLLFQSSGLMAGFSYSPECRLLQE
jgi:hypothetical protein